MALSPGQRERGEGQVNTDCKRLPVRYASMIEGRTWVERRSSSNTRNSSEMLKKLAGSGVGKESEHTPCIWLTSPQKTGLDHSIHAMQMQATRTSDSPTNCLRQASIAPMAYPLLNINIKRKVKTSHHGHQSSIFKFIHVNSVIVPITMSTGKIFPLAYK